jgi:hypothetical protein
MVFMQDPASREKLAFLIMFSSFIGWHGTPLIVPNRLPTDI